MQKCIWLGKVSETGENYVATESGVQKVRTVRRLQPDFKSDLALLNKVSGTPWAPRRNTYNPSFATLLDTQLQPSEKRRSTRVGALGQQRPVQRAECGVDPVEVAAAVRGQEAVGQADLVDGQPGVALQVQGLS